MGLFFDLYKQSRFYSEPDVNVIEVDEDSARVEFNGQEYRPEEETTPGEVIAYYKAVEDPKVNVGVFSTEGYTSDDPEGESAGNPFGWAMDITQVMSNEFAKKLDETLANPYNMVEPLETIPVERDAINVSKGADMFLMKDIDFENFATDEESHEWIKSQIALTGKAYVHPENYDDEKLPKTVKLGDKPVYVISEESLKFDIERMEREFEEQIPQEIAARATMGAANQVHLGDKSILTALLPGDSKESRDFDYYRELIRELD